MPAVGNSEMIRFGGLETQPVPGTDYTLEQISGDKLKLTYKTAFLKQHEWGNGDLGATLTLYADDGRKFKKPYAFSIKSNTSPPKPKIAVAKTKETPAHYVLCLTVPDMDKRIAGGLIHKDITSITIGTEKYDFSLNDGQTAFVKPANDFIDCGDTEQLSEPDADTVPSGWTLYYKTDVEVKDGAAKKDYTIKLIDKEGLVSETLYASTKPNKAEAPACEIIRGKKNDALSGNGTAESTAVVIAAATEEPVVQIKLQSATSAVDVNCTVTEGGSTTSVQYKGNPVTVPLNLNGGDEKLYKVEYYADGTGYKTTDTQTVYFKVLRQHTVTFDANGGAYSDGSTTVSKTALHGTVVAAPNPLPTRDGYGVTGWYKRADGSGAAWNFATDTVTSNITLYAKWTAGSGTGYQVEHYQQKIADDNYAYLEEETLYGTTGATIVADTIKKDYPGFEYDHMNTTSPTITGDGNTVVKLYYKRKTYQVDFRVDGLGGTISATDVTGGAVGGSPVAVKHGGSVTFTATPDSGYAVDSWTGATVNTSDNKKATLSNITGDTTVTVKFKKVYTVKFRVVDGEGGQLKGSYGGQTKIANYNNDGSEQTFTNVSNGDTVGFSAVPDLGWKVKGWTLNGSSVNGISENYNLSNVTGNKTVMVEFERVTTIQHGNNFAWKLLKNAVKVAVDGATITIDGEIKASDPYAGDWGEIVIDKNLTIKRADGATSAVLDANGLSRIFKVKEGETLTLENLTLTGGKATGTGDEGSGGAIFTNNASTVTITNCIITGNEAATNGGGLNVKGTYTTITNCTFTGNTAKNGGGIYIIQGNRIPVVKISGGTIGGTGTNEANEATGTGSDGNGGGIYVGAYCKVILQNDGSTGCSIKGNTAQRGGGVYANNADVSMQGGTQIAVDNDVYLDDTSRISVVGTLTNNPVARITPENYRELPSVKVLDGTPTLLSSEHTKFQVTPNGSVNWYVGSDGNLTQTQP